MLVVEGYRDCVIAIVIVEIVALYERNLKKRTHSHSAIFCVIDSLYTPHCLYCWYV